MKGKVQATAATLITAALCLAIIAEKNYLITSELFESNIDGDFLRVYSVKIFVTPPCAGKTPLGYTTAVPESASTTDDSAYDMAFAIEQHQQREAFNAISSASESAPRQQILARKSVNSAPFTSAVSESSPTSDSAANNWASEAFENRDETRKMARSLFAGRMEKLRSGSGKNPARQQALSETLVSEISKSQLGRSATIREGPARHEVRAWGWATDAFQQHRDAALRSKSTKTPPHPTAMARAVPDSVQPDTKVERMKKLRAAREAMISVHTTTQQGERADFVNNQHKAQLRENEVCLGTTYQPCRFVCIRQLMLSPSPDSGAGASGGAVGERRRCCKCMAPARLSDRTDPP